MNLFNKVIVIYSIYLLFIVGNCPTSKSLALILGDDVHYSRPFYYKIYSLVCFSPMNLTTPTQRLQQDLFCDMSQKDKGNHYSRSTFKYNASEKDPNAIVKVAVKFSPVFFEIEEDNKWFDITGIIQLQWMSNYLKWNPSDYESVTEFKVPSDSGVWFPSVFKLNNADDYDDRFLIQRGDRHDLGEITIRSNGSISMGCAVKVYAYCESDPEAWPFEEWTCEFNLANSPDKTVILKSFHPQVNIDTSSLRENHNWKIVSTPAFQVVQQPNENLIQLSITFQRHVFSYKNIFIHPSLALLSLSLLSFWLIDRIYSRILVNILTTTVQLLLLLSSLTLMQSSGSRGTTLYNFYVDSIMTSIIGIMFALKNAKLMSKITNTPGYMFEVIDVATAVPYAGPILSNLIFDQNYGHVNTKDDEDELIVDKNLENNQKWKIINKFFDVFAFVIILLYFILLYGLKWLI